MNMTAGTKAQRHKGTEGTGLSVAGNHSGLTLLEILIAIAVLLIGILAVVKIFPEGFVTIDRTNSTAVANSLAVYQLEECKSLGYEALPAIQTPPDGSNTDFYFLNCPAGFTVKTVEIAPNVSSKYVVQNSSTYSVATGVDATGDEDNDLDDIRVVFDSAPAATALIRLGFEVNVWKDKLAYSFDPGKGIKDGLEEGSGLVYVEYAADVASTMTATGTETPLKLATVNITWKERGKERSISRQALIGK